ncbi:MAG: LytR/AlgR family response regulator transcription factor [Flectobacillus sp.]|uniref:LytR/AlgR family response regulator transcription factor n=1 Tax=Flectobacillus sp. TaxID=50419 RepID=UPI003B99021D
MKIRCILLDDEPFALNILEDDLLQFSEVEVLAKFYDANDALAFLEANEVDVLFSDIQMPEILGTQFVKTLEKPPLVIFTTAYNQYAVEGFELDAVDYLVKPIRKERIAIALKKVEDRLKLRELPLAEELPQYIIVNAEYKKVKIFYDEILYIEGLKDYVKIYIHDKTYPILTRSNLRGIENKLSEQCFVRIHNSYIVNKQKITGFHHSKVLLSKIELPVGKKYINNIKALQ